MKHGFNMIASGKRQHIEGVLTGLRREFNKLAPNPDQPGAKGPQLVRETGRGMDSNDSIMGTLIAESFLGGVYGEAVMDALGAPDWAAHLDYGKMVDMYDTYNRDRASSPQSNSARDLTMVVQRAPMTMDEFIGKAMRKAWAEDMPARMKLESSFAHFSAMLDRLEAAQFDMPAHKMKDFGFQKAA